MMRWSAFMLLLLRVSHVSWVKKDVALGSTGADIVSGQGRQPIILDRFGGFQIGGKVTNSPEGPNLTLACDHGYMEYFIPQTPGRTSLVMWHSSSPQVWQNRWDGGEGNKVKFLRRNNPVYLWDGPRVGRANWACALIETVPKCLD